MKFYDTYAGFYRNIDFHDLKKQHKSGVKKNIVKCTNSTDIIKNVMPLFIKLVFLKSKVVHI